MKLIKFITEKLKNHEKSIYISCFSFIIMMFFVMPVYIMPIMIAGLLVAIYKIQKQKTYILFAVIYGGVSAVFGLLTGNILPTLIAGLLNVLVLYFVKFKSAGTEAGTYLKRAFLVMMPLLLMLFVEFMQENMSVAISALFNGGEFLPNHLVFCYMMVLIWAIFFFIKEVFGSGRVAFILTNVPILILGFANMIVLSLTSQPLVPSDIFTFTTAMDVIHQQTLSYGLLVMILISIALMAIYFILGWRALKGDKKQNRKVFKELILFTAILFMCLLVNLADLLNFRANQIYGYLCFFINEIQGELEEPEDYEVQNISTALENPAKSENAPNVIFIMSEAFADFERTYGVEASEEVLPYFHSLLEEYPNGKTYASILGNNTCSSELESLTGISTGFAEKGANIYQRHIEDLDGFYSIGEYYQSLGYKAMFFHPCAELNYNRKDVYKTFGYDKAVFLEDLPVDTETLRDFVSDKANFETVTNLITETKEPLFLMNITMQNHGSYEKELDISPYIDITNAKGEYSDVEQYLSLLRKSDDDLRNFLSGIEASGEPTVILFYGDHQPMVDREFYSEYIGVEDFYEMALEEKVQTYGVPYLVWSNYDVESEFVFPEQTSMNYLSMLINSYLGNEKTEWLSLLKELREYYPVITENFVMDAEGNVFAMDELQKMILEDDGSDKGLSLLKTYWYGCYTLVKQGKM